MPICVHQWQTLLEPSSIMLEVSLVLGCFGGWLVGWGIRKLVFESYHVLAYYSHRAEIVAIWMELVVYVYCCWHCVRGAKVLAVACDSARGHLRLKPC